MRWHFFFQNTTFYIEHTVKVSVFIVDDDVEIPKNRLQVFKRFVNFFLQKYSHLVIIFGRFSTIVYNNSKKLVISQFITTTKLWRIL